MNNKFFVIGLDIGGTEVKGGIADEKGTLIHKLEAPSQLYKKENFLEGTAKCIENLAAGAKVNMNDIRSIAAGIPELRVKDTDIYVRPLLKDYLENKFKKPVFVDNDANIGALGEHRFGAGVGTKNLVYMAIGTGIGGGIIIDGKLYRGHDGVAGEFGHISVNPTGPRCACGNYGCLHLVASGNSLGLIARAAITKGEKTKLKELVSEEEKIVPVEKIVEAVKLRDEFAIRLISGTIRYIGVAVVILINILNPEMVIIGGGVAQAGPILFIPLRKIVEEQALTVATRKTKIVEAKFGKEAGILGAIALALEGM
ncbi:MAG: ROK family protein [Candidatus Saganbacteria bacterium]|nr:ROK family protein [Candidatus Saganbacteria bacterium]